jgi:hypothetical protein
MKVQYELVESENVKDLVGKVNTKLEEGWELYGSPTGSISVAKNQYGTSERSTYIQAMVKSI